MEPKKKNKNKKKNRKTGKIIPRSFITHINDLRKRKKNLNAFVSACACPHPHHAHAHPYYYSHHHHHHPHPHPTQNSEAHPPNFPFHSAIPQTCVRNRPHPVPAAVVPFHRNAGEGRQWSRIRKGRKYRIRCCERGHGDGVRERGFGRLRCRSRLCGGRGWVFWKKKKKSRLVRDVFYCGVEGWRGGRVLRGRS